MLAVFKRELRSYFNTPIGYIFMAAFLFFGGLFFALINLFGKNPDFSATLGNITFIFLLTVPILTMRLLSEERNKKTDQLLLTSPLSLSGIVLGKYFAAVFVFLISLLITALYPFIISIYGILAGWEILGSYIGFFLMGAAFISVGLFISALTENQLIAAILTFVVLLLNYLIDALMQIVPTSTLSGIIFIALVVLGLAIFIYLSTRNAYIGILWVLLGGAATALIGILNASLYQGLIVKVLTWLSLLDRYNEFSMGILSLSPIVYYLTFSAIFVFLTVRTQEKRRWS
jgi:ABC-2 type transport system permease protein